MIDSTDVGPTPNGVADLDGDGDPDLIAPDYFGNKIVWYENDNLNWRKDTVDINIVGPIIGRPADIDGDEDLDIVAQGNFANLVVWYENNLPNADWTKHIIDEDLAIAEFVDVGDIDNDGDWDVVATGYLADAVVWYENNFPDTIWRKYTIDNNLNGATAVACDDIDGDGDPDVVATGSVANDVVWYENNLPDTIWNKQIIDGDLLDVMGGNIADLDNDDRPDIIPINAPVGPQIWYKNTLPTWEKKIIESGIAGGGGYPTDLDGDGLLDLIIEGGSIIKAWLNNRPDVAQVKSLQSYHPKFIPPEGETIVINGRLYNPENHQVSVLAIIHGDQYTFADSITLYDDGQHNDSLASDNIWGNTKFLSDLQEDIYTIEVSSHDLIDDIHYTLPLTTSFTTIGPIVFDAIVDTFYRDRRLSKRFLFKVRLRNMGEHTLARDISAKLMLISADSCFSMYSDYSEFGDIAPGELIDSNLDFALNINEICWADTIHINLTYELEIESEGKLFWRDTSYIDTTVTDIMEEGIFIPDAFVLEKNFPNPFNPTTVIGYQLSAVSNVELSIYNILGEKVTTLVSEKQNAGHHQVEWNASGFASGVYYYRIEAGEFVDVKKMVLLR